MPIDHATAIARARASIEELPGALSLSNCEKLHADVSGYCRALLDCGVIDARQWRQLVDLADAALVAWQPSPGTPGRLPGWRAEDY